MIKPILHILLEFGPQQLAISFFILVGRVAGLLVLVTHFSFLSFVETWDFLLAEIEEVNTGLYFKLLLSYVVLRTFENVNLNLKVFDVVVEQQLVFL